MRSIKKPIIDSNILIYMSEKKEDIRIEINNEYLNIYEELASYELESYERKIIIETYSSFRMNLEETESEGIEFTEIEESYTSSYNYSPEEVEFTEKPFSLITLYNYMTGFDYTEEPTIDMSPEFQRNYVWSKKQKSSLIESILLNIPIPSIYLNTSEDKKYIPADGLQRLNTVYEFMSGKLKLVELEHLKNLEGATYKSSDKTLSQKQYRHFRDYTINTFIISPKTPNAVKLDVFRRLNTTGTKLNSQEIRNSVTHTNIRKLYKEIEKNEYFQKLIVNSVNTNRFVHHEMILRFFGAYFSQVTKELEYKGKMNLFLDEALEYMTKNSQETIDICYKFYQVLQKSNKLFDTQSFRKPPKGNGEKKRRSPINTLLYTQILIILLDVPVNFNKNDGYMTNSFFEYLENEKDLLFAISSSTSNIKNIEIASKKIKRFFELKGDK
ncbi:DUF262 domain-containing protein [Enterococcus sp. HY326]|uniref:DUF262 domain-containing protein n=1 Tax=Enterococcus sp. HY326 TaxID=2971265 RepID=UPI002240D18A|nr:DUF262 domain-containing protein [Enterococcus sp. HY326]